VFKDSTTNLCSEAVVYGFLVNGPVNVGIASSSADFQNYAGGIWDEACGPADHAVILAGFGTDPLTKKDFWIVRNSWGTDWGNNGYIKVARNLTNNGSCHLTEEAYQPIF